VIHLVRIGCILTVTVYFALNVLHAGWTIPFLFGAMSVGSMLAASVATPYFTKFGFRKGISMSLLFAIAASCLLPLLENYPAYFLAGFCVLCIGAQAGTTAIFALAANACDSQEFKFGSRADGLIFSCISLSTKIGIAVGAALVAYGLGLAQYNPGFVSHEAIQMMRSLFYIVPVALMALQIATILLYRTQGSQYVSP
jgi:GPH family glycoside/pentoside/hexuronide:cation symporter